MRRSSAHPRQLMCADARWCSSEYLCILANALRARCGRVTVSTMSGRVSRKARSAPVKARAAWRRRLSVRMGPRELRDTFCVPRTGRRVSRATLPEAREGPDPLASHFYRQWRRLKVCRETVSVSRETLKRQSRRSRPSIDSLKATRDTKKPSHVLGKVTRFPTFQASVPRSLATERNRFPGQPGWRTRGPLRAARSRRGSTAMASK